MENHALNTQPQPGFELTGAIFLLRSFQVFFSLITVSLIHVQETYLCACVRGQIKVPIEVF